MADPPLLILDEPCAGLDPVARDHFLQFLETLGRRKGAPTLSASLPHQLPVNTLSLRHFHHVEEIAPVFSHVLLLKAGRALAQARKAEVLTTELLGHAFNASVKLHYGGHGYTMSVKVKSRAVM